MRLIAGYSVDPTRDFDEWESELVARCLKDPTLAAYYFYLVTSVVVS